jgi:hypothetical protein
VGKLNINRSRTKILGSPIRRGSELCTTKLKKLVSLYTILALGHALNKLLLSAKEVERRTRIPNRNTVYELVHPTTGKTETLTCSCTTRGDAGGIKNRRNDNIRNCTIGVERYSCRGIEIKRGKSRNKTVLDYGWEALNLRVFGISVIRIETVVGTNTGLDRL